MLNACAILPCQGSEAELSRSPLEEDAAIPENAGRKIDSSERRDDDGKEEDSSERRDDDDVKDKSVIPDFDLFLKRLQVLCFALLLPVSLGLTLPLFIRRIATRNRVANKENCWPSFVKAFKMHRKKKIEIVIQMARTGGKISVQR